MQFFRRKTAINCNIISLSLLSLSYRDTDTTDYYYYYYYYYLKWQANERMSKIVNSSIHMHFEAVFEHYSSIRGITKHCRLSICKQKTQTALRIFQLFSE